RRHVSFMYSYPNYVPLPAPAVERIVRAVAPLAYDRIYGAFWDSVIAEDARTAVARSAQRYLRAIRGRGQAGGCTPRRPAPIIAGGCDSCVRRGHGDGERPGAGGHPERVLPRRADGAGGHRAGVRQRRAGPRPVPRPGLAAIPRPAPRR